MYQWKNRGNNSILILYSFFFFYYSLFLSLFWQFQTACIYYLSSVGLKSDLCWLGPLYSHKDDKTKMSAGIGYYLSLWERIYFQDHSHCWQSSFLCSCRTEILLCFLTVNQESLSFPWLFLAHDPFLRQNQQWHIKFS